MATLGIAPVAAWEERQRGPARSGSAAAIDDTAVIAAAACHKRQQPADLNYLLQQLQGLSLDLDYWTTNARRIASDDPQQRYEGVRQFRMVLSLTGEIPIQAVVDTGVVPLLVRLLEADTALLFESAWALTNIASGTPEQTKCVVEAGAIPRFIQLLSHPLEEVREQGMWGLGNVAGDRPEFRDVILTPETVRRFVSVCATSTRHATVRTGIWALSNLCRGKPRPDVELLRDAVPYLISVLSTADDADTLSDACWALDGISEAPSGRGVAILVSHGAVPALTRLLDHSELSVSRPALRVTGQIATGDAAETQQVIEHGGLLKLKALIASPVKCIRKDACWTLSNLAAGLSHQVESLLQSGCLARLVELFNSDDDSEIQKEVAWSVCNACTVQSHSQLEFLVRCEVVPVLCQAFHFGDIKLLNVAVEAVHNVIRFGRWFQRQQSLSANPALALFAQHELPVTLGALRDLCQNDYSVYKRLGELIAEFAV